MMDLNEHNDNNYHPPERSSRPPPPVAPCGPTACWNFWQKWFERLYPGDAVKAHTASGRLLRKLLLAAMILHLVCSVLTLSLVGPLSFICNLFLVVISFSSFLTLSDTTVLVYILVLLLTMGVSLITVTWALRHSAYHFLVLMVLEIIYVINMIMVVKAVLAFRRQGGVTGHDEIDRFEDGLLSNRP